MTKIATSLTDLQYQVEQRDNLKSNIHLAEVRVRDAKARLDELNQSILDAMAQMQLDNFGTPKYRVTIARKNKIEIVNPALFQSWLAKEYNPEDYLSLDTTRAKALAKNAYETDGELAAGIQSIPTETLSVTPKKGKDESHD